MRGSEERRQGQNLSLRYSPHHRWAYYPRMTRDEALVFYSTESIDRNRAPGVSSVRF